MAVGALAGEIGSRPPTDYLVLRAISGLPCISCLSTRCLSYPLTIGGADTYTLGSRYITAHLSHTFYLMRHGSCLRPCLLLCGLPPSKIRDIHTTPCRTNQFEGLKGAKSSVRTGHFSRGKKRGGRDVERQTGRIFNTFGCGRKR